MRGGRLAHLPVARVDAAAEGVGVGEALDARVLADREHTVLVRVRRMVRIRVRVRVGVRVRVL